MLKHRRETETMPRRTVILGAAGFVGKAISASVAAAGGAVLALGRTELDLLAAGAERKLAELLREDDALVVISARAPCKNNAMLLENIRMMEAVCAALAAKPAGHVVYVSSDAVYADSPQPLTEESCASPDSLHGIMHLTREVMLRNAVGKTPLTVLRPTLLYGPADPHNGYGPNRFRRLANRGEDITLFGNGEERRDHVYIDDVGTLAARVLGRCSEGVLNLATGAVASFREIAEKTVALARRQAKIIPTPRSGPMPHGGYRPFEIAACRKAFPDFRYKTLDEGLALSQAGMDKESANGK